MNRFKILKGIKPPPVKCTKCGDSGVIETGNNDLPCDCPAGDNAFFNVTGEGKVSGKDLKARSKVKKTNPLPSQESEDDFWAKIGL